MHGRGWTKASVRSKSQQPKKSAGDICFPGGKIEKDETPLQCALREFEEETGIPEREAAVLGQFDTLHGFADYTLYTFVAVIDMKSLEKGKVNPAEVKELFTVPGGVFLEKTHLKSMKLI